MNIKNEYNRNTSSVNLKSTHDPNLFVLKYKKSVFYKDTWNDFLRECRGMVVDSDWNIVSLPFTKIHNFGIEASAPHIDSNETVFASRKVNGFMIACTWYNNDLLWSTTGSINSSFVDLATDTFNEWSSVQQAAFKQVIKSRSDHTFMFECVHSKDPHIVPETPGLYFIGIRHKDIQSKVCMLSEDDSKTTWLNTGVKTVETYTVKLHELVDMVAMCKHEGFVFETTSGEHRVSKIKSPHYLTKKLLMRGNWEKFINKGKKAIAEEFYPLYDWINEVEQEKFFILDEIARREYIETFFNKTLKD
jgi:hypothetical protein